MQLLHVVFTMVIWNETIFHFYTTQMIIFYIMPNICTPLFLKLTFYRYILTRIFQAICNQYAILIGNQNLIFCALRFYNQTYIYINIKLFHAISPLACIACRLHSLSKIWPRFCHTASRDPPDRLAGGAIMKFYYLSAGWVDRLSADVDSHHKLFIGKCKVFS